MIQYTSGNLPGQGNNLEKVLLIEQAKVSLFQHLELVVEAFHKATVLTLHKIIGNLFPPVFQGVQKFIEALQFTALDPFDPGTDFSCASDFASDCSNMSVNCSRKS